MVLRMAASWVRFGTFEIFASRSDWANVRRLADYVIEHFYPHVAAGADKYAALLAAVGKRTGGLVGQWQGAGFVHGVLNTDNLSILVRSRRLPWRRVRFSRSRSLSSSASAHPRALPLPLLSCARSFALVRGSRLTMPGLRH